MSTRSFFDGVLLGLAIVVVPSLEVSDAVGNRLGWRLLSWSALAVAGVSLHISGLTNSLQSWIGARVRAASMSARSALLCIAVKTIKFKDQTSRAFFRTVQKSLGK